MVWGVGTTAKEAAEYEGLIAKAENNPDAQAAKQGLASQALRGALKWGGPVHPDIPSHLVSNVTMPLEEVRPVSSSAMRVWKGLNDPYTGQPFADTTGLHKSQLEGKSTKFGDTFATGSNRPIFVSPTQAMAYNYADIDRALAQPWSEPSSSFTPRGGTLLEGNIPRSEVRAGLHFNPSNDAHQILMRAHQADLAFGKHAGLAPNLKPNRAVTMHVPRVNKFALPFDPEMARFPASTKVLGTAARLAPGASIALGAYDTQRRFSQGDYLGAGLGDVSMVPGHIGWAGLGTQALYDLASWYLND